MPGLIHVAAIGTLVLARADGWNCHGFAGQLQCLDHPDLSVISSVCNDRIGCGILEQHISAFQVMGLPGREVKICRIAPRINCRMDLGCQGATAMPDDLALFRLLFLAPRCTNKL